MNTYKRHRFPRDIISYAVWLIAERSLISRDKAVRALSEHLYRTPSKFMGRLLASFDTKGGIPRGHKLRINPSNLLHLTRG